MKREAFTFVIAAVLSVSPMCGISTHRMVEPTAAGVMTVGNRLEREGVVNEPQRMDERGQPVEAAEADPLPDAPSAMRIVLLDAPEPETREYGAGAMPTSKNGAQSHAWPSSTLKEEPYHWKGLLLQSFAFQVMEDATRVMTADQDDRHKLLNKPYWSDYWASLQQFNMRRWNDGDSFPVNYIGHPMQGAISGYIEIQNDPRGRELRISRDPAYWKSVERAFWWSTVYSTASEIGPLGEAAIFNEGGFTYPIGCAKHDEVCRATTNRYTNNTGWVDFIITPIVGTLWLLGEDTLDRYVSDPLVDRHPNAFGYKALRMGLNPPRSLANLLRGRYPWYRDYEHPNEFESPIVEDFTRVTSEESEKHVDINPHYTLLTLQANTDDCTACRRVTTEGGGVELGIRVRRYLDLTADVGVQPDVSPVPSPNIGGSLLLGNFGVRTGYSGKWFAVKVTLAPGFASYSKTQSSPDAPIGRIFNFSAVAALSGDLRFTGHFGIRVTAEQMLIRYKSADRDPPGIGTPPWLSFLSHDNYVNSTNWGMRIGPVFRF